VLAAASFAGMARSYNTGNGAVAPGGFAKQAEKNCKGSRHGVKSVNGVENFPLKGVESFHYLYP
jgi:hypothetical protein